MLIAGIIIYYLIIYLSIYIFEFLWPLKHKMATTRLKMVKSSKHLGSLIPLTVNTKHMMIDYFRRN